MPQPDLKFGSCTVLLRLGVDLLRLKHRNLKSRVGLRLHLCDWGAGIDIAYRLCTHYVDDLYHTMVPDNYAATGVFHSIHCA